MSLLSEALGASPGGPGGQTQGRGHEPLAQVASGPHPHPHLSPQESPAQDAQQPCPASSSGAGRPAWTRLRAECGVCLLGPRTCSPRNRPGIHMTPLGIGASWGQDLVLCPRPRGPLTQPPSSRHPRSCSAFPQAGVPLAGPLHTPTAHWASPPPAPAGRAAPICGQPGEVVAVQSVPGLCGTRGRPPVDPMPAQGARAAPRHPGLRGRTPASQPQVWAGPLLLLPPGDVRLAPRTGRHARPHGPSRHAHWGRPQCPSRLRTRVRAPDGGSELSPRPGVGRGAGSPAATCSGRGSGASQAGPHLGELPPADGGAPGPQGREEGRLASRTPRSLSSAWREV